MSIFKQIDINNPLDVFGRLLVSEQITVADLKQIHDALPLFIDSETNGTGAATYNTGESSTTISTAASGDWVVAQTFQRFPYQSGKGLPALLTLYDFAPETNVTKRVGCFSSSVTTPFTAERDGIYLESSGGNIYIKIDKTGTNIDSIIQSSWLDPLDGTGASGYTVNWSNNQIVKIEYEWLGVGAVVFKLLDSANLRFIPFLAIGHTNNQQGVYMRSPNKPLRWEIRQDGAGSGSLTYICSGVSIEGTINKIGITGGEYTGTNTINCNTVGVSYALLGIRLKSSHLDTIIDLLDGTVVVSTTDIYRLTIRLNPTVAGTFTYAGVANYGVEVAVGDTVGNPSTNTVTGGTILQNGVFYETTDVRFLLKNAIKLGAAIDGTADTMVICLTPITANVNAYCAINWLELN